MQTELSLLKMPQWKYDVFVSFRGEDIRKSFIDHLFNAFKQKGIHAFRDNIELPRGEEISPELYKAIEKSRFLMVVFSKHYASSSWCLKELVKILNLMQTGNPKYEVRIIFYDVKPEVVRKQTESYAESFAIHEVVHRAEVDEWKKALSMAANLSGCDLNDMTNGYESKFINTISEEMRKMLCDGPLYVGENLVGVDARVNKLDLMRFIGSSKVNMIGICGISGIGKTTLAKAIYNKMYAYFEGSCFCEDVKQRDLTQIQMQFINEIMKSEDVKIHGKSEGIMVIKNRLACEPILVVLDDVDHRDQLEALAGSNHWFCPGSLIIFTSKDKQLLRSHEVEIYEMEFLDRCEDNMLFCLYAFHQTYPTHDFNNLASQAVEYLQGHPLALKVVGSALFEKPVHIWRSELDRLQMYPNSEIQKKLRPSFDLLDFDQRRIFLDIACSLIGENIHLSARVLDSSNCFADASIEVLVDKSLITISSDDNLLRMHELIRSMAREIIREESPPVRLWGPPEVYSQLLENNVTEATNAVEVFVLLLKKSTKAVHIDCKAFSKMKKLRILKICHPEPKPEDLSVNFSGSLDFLSKELRLIYWCGYPFEFLPSNFYPENVVAIDLSFSNIKSFWTTPKCFKRLKVMKLRHCRNLTTTPDFTEMVNLEKLILEGCVSLVKLHPSIGMLKKLAMLNVDGTAITGFPSFLSSLTNLQVLKIGRYQQTETLTWWPSIFQRKPNNLVLPSLASLRLLTELRVRNCNISEVCPDIGALSCLTSLDLSGNNFTKLPGSLSQLSRLEDLVLKGCKKLEVIPELPPCLTALDAADCTSLQEPPRVIRGHNPLKYYLPYCPKLFGNVSMSQTQLIASSTTSHASTNQIFLLVEYLDMQSRIREFFDESGSLSEVKTLDILFYGNEIPGWFTNRSKGSCHVIKVELPPNWCYSKFKGYAISAVFTARGNFSIPGCYVSNSDGAFLGGMEASSRLNNKDTMIWLYFQTRDSRWEKAKNFVTFSFRAGEVKACGVRLVYDGDEDLKEEETALSMIQHLPQCQPENRGGYLWLAGGGDGVYMEF